MTNIHGIDPMLTGSKDYEKITEMLKNKQGTKVEDDELLFKTMQYYNLSGSSNYWSEDALELDVEELIEKWKEFDKDDTSFAKDFDEFDAYLQTYKKEDPPGPPEPPGPEGGEVTDDTIIEFNGVRYEVYKKFNSNPSETLKYYKAEDGRTVFNSEGWNITVIGSMNTTGDKHYADVVIEGNRNTFFGSDDDDTVEIRGNNNNIHGDSLDIGGANDKITITSGSGNYIYGEDGEDEVDADESLLTDNFFNKAYKDVEKLNGENIFNTPAVEPTPIAEEPEPVPLPETVHIPPNEEPAPEIVPETDPAPAATVSTDSPQYALTDEGVYHKYTLALLGLISEDGTASPPSREDLEEFGIDTEEELENPALFEKIRRNSDLTEQLAPMTSEVSEEDPDSVTDVINIVSAQNVLDMYESCATGDNKDKAWAAKMMELCLATGLIVLENEVAKIAEEKQEDTVDAKALFKLAMQMEE